MTRMLLIALLFLAAASAPAAASPGKDADDLLTWIEDHPRRAGLAVYAGEAPLLASADRRFPLGSTRKVLILGAYARAAAAGRLDPAERVRVDAIERWYWPGTDGDAHPSAVADWSARGVPADGTVPLDEVAWAMIRWSDNAAADYLLERVGARAVNRFADRHGMTRQDPIAPVFGEFLAWTATSPSRWARRSPGARADVAATLARVTPPGDVANRSLPRIARQRRFAASSTAGTPREWARLMRDLHAGRGLSPAAHAIVRRHLEWPLVAFPELGERLTRLGEKGGALPGVTTDAIYAQAPSGAPAAAALFLRDLPRRLERELAVSFVHQELLLRLALDRDFRAAARARLTG